MLLLSAISLLFAGAKAGDPVERPAVRANAVEARNINLKDTKVNVRDRLNVLPIIGRIAIVYSMNWTDQRRIGRCA